MVKGGMIMHLSSLFPENFLHSVENVDTSKVCFAAYDYWVDGCGVDNYRQVDSCRQLWTGRQL
ncbi:predicted protein [Botrytis cinerea T4]|uniref:Uncharacterized protein n=1 Tax=Botryotinia fuckeliana (strain T4) TaxID=999810 RepID=G2XWK3_BOTF4|nr:predicted protein [Botrytis cinerea T4]